MNDEHKAVFLSYASQDAEAAKRICDALRHAGIEVWFDQSELRGGDAWDAMIRKRIKECALFVPLITPTTNARAEGYFRLEWKLAVDRSHLMADDEPFLFPIVLGDVSDSTARVPDKFRDVQWTRLRLDETPGELAGRVVRLLSGSKPEDRDQRTEVREERAKRRDRPAWVRNLGMIGGLAIGLIYALRSLFVPEHRTEDKPAAVAPAIPPPPALPGTEADQLIARAEDLCAHLNYSRDNLAAAEDLLRKATELASDSARAWGARAYIQSNYILRGWDSGDKRREDTQTFARRALALDPNEAEAMLALSVLLNQQRAFAQAETLALRGIALRPDDFRLRSALISSVIGQGRTAEAFALAQDNVRRFPREPLTYYGLANGYRLRGQFEEALANYESALALQPFAGALLYKTLGLATWRGDIPAARAALEQVMPADRGEDRAVAVAMWLGLVERKPARVHEAAALTARAYFEDLLTPGPKAWAVAFAHQLEGKATLARQQWQAAEEVLRQRLRDHPDSGDDRARLATTLVRLGRADEAAREMAPFEAGAKEQPGPRSAYLLAQYYAALGDAAQAAPQLARAMNQQVFVTPHALRLDPQWDKLRGQPEFEALLAPPALNEGAPPVRRAQGSEQVEGLAARAVALYTKVGFTRDDLAPAEDFARRATEKEPDSAAAWGVRAGVQAAWLFRNWDKSEKRRQDLQAWANRALALDPNEPEALLALGHLLREMGASEQAVAHLRRARIANPDHVRLGRALGYTFTQLGRNEEARAVLLEILPRAPQDPLLRYELALSYCSYGPGGANPAYLAAAFEHLDAALAIQPFASALVLKAALAGGWRGDLPAMRAVLDQLGKLSLAERSEDRAVCVAMWAGLIEHRPDRVEAAAALTARNYFDDGVLPLHPKAWWLAQAHRQAGKENLARADWQAAEAVLRQRLKDEPGNQFYKAELAITLAWLGRREEAAQLIGEVEPIWKEEPTFRTPRLLALYYAAVGDAARAAPYLRTRMDENVFTTRHVMPLDPMWDKLRGQPEFEALLKEPAARK